MRARAMSYQSSLITAEEFLRIQGDDYRYELVEGRVVRMSPPGGVHGMIAVHLASLLDRHVRESGLGVVLGETGYTLARNPDTVRGPDLSFIRRERIPPAGVPESFWEGAPDLAVEIRSPGDGRGDIQAKVDEYLTRGVLLLWIVEPRKKTVTAYRRLSPPVVFGLDDTLDADDVVAGFRCSVRELFE